MDISNIKDYADLSPTALCIVALIIVWRDRERLLKQISELLKQNGEQTEVMRDLAGTMKRIDDKVMAEDKLHDSRHEKITERMGEYDRIFERMDINITDIKNKINSNH